MSEKMLTFQHIGTARHRGEENGMDVILYGRQADGTSVSVKVEGIKAYGFTNVKSIDRATRLTLNRWVQWLLSMQCSNRSTTKYKKENNANKPTDKVLDNWHWWFNKFDNVSIEWEQVSGFNIRYVRDVPPPIVWKFTVDRYDVWRVLLTILKNPVSLIFRSYESPALLRFFFSRALSRTL